MEGGALTLQASGRNKRRLRKNLLAEIAAVAAALTALAVLGILIGSVLTRAFSALNWDFFTKGPAIFGQTGGGIAPAIVGSLMLVAIATVISVPIGVLSAIYVSEFSPKAIASQIQLWLD